jgi:hypothetical protein
MNRSVYGFTAAVGLFSLCCGHLIVSSHSDAPLSKQDPQTNLTDVYGFMSANNTLTIVVNCRPFSEPGDGAMYERFADDALYSINIANPNTGALLMTYNFQFSPVSSAAGNYKNKQTILSYGRGTTIGAIQNVGDGAQNYTQTYSVTAVNAMTGGSTVIGSSFMVPPPNTGLRTTPAYNNSTTGYAVSGATSSAALDTYTREAVYTASTGEMIFAGSRDDSFFADAPGIFDLLDPRILGPDGHGQTGNGVDGFKGYNVLTFAVQIPLANLPTAIPSPMRSPAPRTVWESTPRSAARELRCAIRPRITPTPVPGSKSTASAILSSTRFWLPFRIRTITTATFPPTTHRSTRNTPPFRKWPP